ncbi:MAG TPA: hypothetical protein VKG92_03950, partial [Flavobacteriales bacterium]|nr:hypothetical protein [Flavobacteriales bacterium]
MTRTTRSLLIHAFAFLGAASGYAQEIGFTAGVDHNTIAVGEYVRLTIALTNSSERFAPPDLGGLVVVQG